jgi:opacity protein-like surface antigen
MSLKSKPLFVLPLMAGMPVASAADMPVMPPPEVSPINYLSIEGGPVWLEEALSDSGEFTDEDKFGDIGDQDGFYAAITYRRMFNPNWDWQITGTATWFDELSDSSDDFGGNIRSDLDFQTIDLDAGYHFNGNPLTRFLFGIRVLHSDDSLRFTADFNTRQTFDAEGWAFGPRVGIQSETMLGSSNFGFVAEASGSILFGSFDTDTFTSDTGTSDSYSDSRTLYNLEGLAGLSWHASDRLTFTAGYRLQQWWNLREGTSISDFGDFFLTADGDPLVHGPFLRAATTF